MRLSTSMIYQRNLDAISESYSKWENTGQQLATGKRVNVPSDDPIAASQAIKLGQSQALNSQYSAARTSATNSLSAETTVLEQVTDVIQSAQTLLVQAGDGTLSDQDRQSLATQLQSYKDQLLNLANSQDGNGNYLFAGYKTNSAPFVEAEDGSVSYSGGGQAMTQQVDASRSMTVGDTGSAVFMSLTAGYTTEPDGGDSESNIFNTLDIALKALTTPQQDADSTVTVDYTAAIGKASRGLSNSLDNVLAVQSSVGSKLNELDNLDSLGTSRNTLISDNISALVDVDWYQAISDYSQQQVALQAAYSTFTAMQSMSLFSQ
ncbi:flagellar biosynthesis; hook-filament junction protein [Candidatus Sodalis pierantonius str. SOPE]|uniref:Flagellar biosynthesis hook-filament junction protein n=1 Tax=Candidatus Sodalis pierantonii str. SOPE TaxID=2342 RepID=W0HRX9_9GAMM|nr:flagellar hook-associated protein FlgL [Candidatus Sodalis pierantonius]AHF74940.1 flagellar biosynthesis; hook-filament junction protein [Candidatus Sodalis pierantonius str. SOPE]